MNYTDISPEYQGFQYTPETCPNHKMEDICQCGENHVCHTCGFGCGGFPCKCISQYEFDLVSLDI